MPKPTPVLKLQILQITAKIFAAIASTLTVVAISGSMLVFWGRLFETISGRGQAAPLKLKFGAALLGGYACALIITALAYHLLLLFSRLVERRFHGRISSKNATIGGFFIAAFYPFYATGKALASGDWIAAQPYAFAIPSASAVVGASSFLLLAFLMHNRKTWVRVVSALCCGLGSLLTLYLDAVAFAGLYAPFHRLAFALSIVTMFLCIVTAEDFLKKIRLPRFAAVALQVSACALIVFSICSFVTLNDRGRALLLARSRASEYLLVAANLHEKSPVLGAILNRIEEGRPVIPEQISVENNRPVPEDWNIVLIVVDAMRADTLPPNRRTKKQNSHVKNGDTPFLEDLVTKMVRFRYAYSPSNKTVQSMPSIFSGLTPESLRHKKAVPLPRLMKRAGRRPIAVVNKLFSSKNEKLEPLLRGFEKVTFYPDRKQHDAVDKMLSAVDDVRSRPFFAWFHFYALHNPYYAEGGVQRDSTGSFPARYRNALKWVDKEMEKLFAGFEKRDLTDHTIFVLTADHGEGLGDHDLNTHGSYIFEEETRVPFYLLIPGQKGETVSHTVSLIDLVATLSDMVGRPAPETDGVSLRPLIDNPRQPWERYYYLENSTNNHIGIVKGRTKLMYLVDSKTLYRFDLTKDLREKRNRFKLEKELDQRMLSHLLYHRPDLFIDALSDGQIKTTYNRLLEQIGPLDSNAARLLRRIEAERKRKESAQ